MVLTAISISLRFALKNGYKPMQYVIDFCGAAGLMYLIAFSYYEFFVEPYDLDLILFMSLAGFTLAVGMIFQNFAIKYGKGGLVLAIT